MVGNLLVGFLVSLFTGVSDSFLCFFKGNYDISEMHYEGPGNVPGAPIGGYGYDVRIEGLSSSNTSEILQSA